MAVSFHLPKAVTVDQFKGGFKSTSDYTDLADTETNDARNTEYGPNGDIKQRDGSVKLYNIKLTETGQTGANAGRPITGHFYYKKLTAAAETGQFHVVAAGDRLYNYTSATASAIATGLNTSSQTYWNFVQIQDPRSATDDILIGVNGENIAQVWNGSGNAVALSTFDADAYAVTLSACNATAIAKYILQHENRIYMANIKDSSDVDSPVRVLRSGFGSDGAPDPHRLNESFYVGGSDKDGGITGMKILNDDIIFYRPNSIWKFSPGLGDTNDLQRVVNGVGCYAPYSLIDVGNLHIFLSERGVYAFDGTTVLHISQKIDDILLKEVNQTQLQYSKAVYDTDDNIYKLYIPEQQQSRNQFGIAFDLRDRTWQPPITGRNVSYISSYFDDNARSRIIYGDYHGYLYDDKNGKNDGIATGYNGTATSASTNTLEDNGTASVFPTTNDGLAGLKIKILDGTGKGEEHVILSNTSEVITIDGNWGIAPVSGSTYTIGGINAYWRSKDYDFTGHDVMKLFRHVRARLREKGNFNLQMDYIVDFRTLTTATRKAISMLDAGMAWGATGSTWGTTRWGAALNIKKKISLRSTANQSTNGTHMALRFSNERANEDWQLTGYDIEIQLRGKE